MIERAGKGHHVLELAWHELGDGRLAVGQDEPGTRALQERLGDEDAEAETAMLVGWLHAEAPGRHVGLAEPQAEAADELRRELGSLGLDGKLLSIDHHASHAAGAYLTSGFDDAIAITLDWYGGGLSGSVNLCTPAGIRRLHNIRYPHSLGLFYAQVTSGLGFTASQHEGKIVGLAAFGDTGVLGPALLARFVRKNGDISYVYLDPDYFLEIRVIDQRVEQGAQVEIETDLGDYEKDNGVYFPFSIESGNKGSTDKQKGIVEKAEANIPVDDSIFEFPAKAAK